MVEDRASGRSQSDGCFTRGARGEDRIACGEDGIFDQHATFRRKPPCRVIRRRIVRIVALEELLQGSAHEMWARSKLVRECLPRLANENSQAGVGEALTRSGEFAIDHDGS